MDFIDIFNFSNYFKRLNDRKIAKIGHVNAVIDELNNIIEEFLILTVNSDTIPFKKMDEIINGKVSWFFRQNDDVIITIQWDKDTTSWVLLQGEVVMGSMLDMSDGAYPYSGLYGSFNVTIKLFLGTTQEIIEKLAELIVQTNTNQALETETYIDSASILTLGTTPVELLPNAGVGRYYDIQKIVLEYTAGSLNYTCVDQLILAIQTNNGEYYSTFEGYYLTDAEIEQYVWISNSLISSTIGINYMPISAGFSLNSNIMLAALTPEGNSTILQDGNGTLKAKIYYKIITFGA